MTEIPMFDTVSPHDLAGHIPTRPKGEAVAGYKQGNSFIDSALLFHLFPNAYHLEIGGTGGAGYRCADVETGFGTLGRFGDWLVNGADLTKGPPVGYTFASQMAELQAVAHNLGIPSADHDKPAPTFKGGSRLEYLRAVGVLWWSAHFNFRPHVCAPNVCGFPRAHAGQWTDRALPLPLDADQSLIENDAVFFPAGHAPAPDPHHFRIFCSGMLNPDGKPRHPGGNRGGPWDSPFGQIDERETVLQFYGAHKHPAHFAEWLKELRSRMLWLAQRLDRVAIILEPHTNGKPSWDVDDRGERHARLARMATTGDLA